MNSIQPQVTIKSGCIVKTGISSLEIRQFELYLIDQKLDVINLTIDCNTLNVVLVFRHDNDALIYKLKGLESHFNENKPFMFEPDVEFENELKRQYGQYTSADMYYN